jgi:hypothetical protein
MVENEWPAMAENHRSQQTWRRSGELWTTILAVKPGGDEQNGRWQ